jgi:oxygen-independent coproporphyrinogen-3 oxidase
MSLGVYIQVPFCQTKCTYCNFHTGVASPAAYAPYARAVESEIRNWRELYSAAGLQSVGNLTGGTHNGSGDGAPAANCHPEGGRDAESKFPPGTSRSTEARTTEGSAFAFDFNVAPGFSPASPSHVEVATADTIYVGGGTPSLFDPADLARLLDAVRSQFAEAQAADSSSRARAASIDAGAPSIDECCHHEETRPHVFMRTSDEGSAFPNARGASISRARAANTEVTLEADPETITPEKAAAWLAAGINRISLGAQSFHDAELKPAGRMHRRADIFAAIAHLRAAGFANISLDLIAGLPHQTAASWQESVDEALRLRPEHISIYLFEIDEGSRLGRELLSGGARYSAAAVPSDDAMADSYEFACASLARAGYEHYEISNWALPGFRSRHNLKYWRREPYLGFGAGAHSFDGCRRWANAHDPAAYAAAIGEGRLPVEQLEEVTPRQALDEELFLGLRQLEGIDLAQIAAQYAPQFDAAVHETLGARIEELRAQGLVERDGTRVRLAPASLTVSNEVFVALLGS